MKYDPSLVKYAIGPGRSLPDSPSVPYEPGRTPIYFEYTEIIGHASGAVSRFQRREIIGYKDKPTEENQDDRSGNPASV